MKNDENNNPMQESKSMHSLGAIQDLFLHRPDFLLPCTLYYAFKKMFLQKNHFNFYSLKVTKFHK